MCGIAGFYGSKLPTRNNIIKSSKLIRHRGPDASGTIVLKKDKLVLIHRRLSIIDLDQRSNQPMEYENTILIFNGEIYNYIEIKKKLISMGHTFKTNSDTEVLIHALKQWKEKAVDFLEGMWAFAWYDNNTKKLILSRDRFGEKPLYYFFKEKNFFFSSEIKSLSALSFKKFKIDFEKIEVFLKNGYKSSFKDKNLFFKDVFQIKPGSLLIVYKNKKIKSIDYWKKKRKILNKKITYKEIIDKNKTNLIKSVKLRTRSDVPIGFCMSSGVDSNGLISIAKKKLKQNIIGYNIYSKNKNYDEYGLAKKSAKKLNIKLKLVKVPRTNFLNNLRKIIQSRGYPLFTISYFLHWFMMRQMKKDGIKVSISGSAADEIYSGYIDHFNQYLYQIKSNQALLSKTKSDWHRYFQKFIQNKNLRKYDLYFKNKNFREHIYDKYPNEIFVNQNKSKFYEKNFSKDLLRNRMMNELYHETVPVLLHEDDLNSMNFSIENRTPYLDSKIYDFIQTIPTKHLIKNGYLKSILRDSLNKITPNFIIKNRQKIGFNASIYDYINIRSKSFKSIIESKSKIFNIINRKKFYEFILKNKTPENSKLIFRFLSAKFFLDQNT
jgi:asparagine synthase (glutamine-hydrolysing)